MVRRGNIDPHAGPALARARADAARTAPQPAWHGMCLRRVRTWLGIGPDLEGDAPDASGAWSDVPPAHRHGFWDPPAAVPYFWESAHGHVALCDGHGNCWSVDVPSSGRVALIPLSWVHTHWGLHPLGWTETLNHVRVFTPGPVPAT